MKEKKRTPDTLRKLYKDYTRPPTLPNPTTNTKKNVCQH